MRRRFFWKENLANLYICLFCLIFIPALSTILFRSGLKWGSWFWHKRKASWRERCRWAASYWSRTRNTSSVHSFHIGEHLCLLLHFKSSCDPQVLLCLVVCLAAILFCLQSRYDGDYLGGAHTFTYNVHNTHENYFETWSMYTIIGQDLDNKLNKIRLQGLVHAFLLILLLVQLGTMATHRWAY